MSIEHNDRFLDQLRRHEGLRLEPYTCTAGRLTVGYGHNLEAHPMPGGARPITKLEALRLLEDDVAEVCRVLDKRLPWWRELSAPRQGVLANMAFNLGIGGLCGFARMLAAAETGDWNRAAREMLDSKWAVQVKGRASELATQMVTGAWQEG